MKALRLPARASAVTYWFRSGGPRFTSPFVPASLRSRWQEDSIEPGFLVQPVNPLAGALLRGRKTGPLRFAGDPSHAFAKLRDPGRTDQASPLTASSMLPPPRGRRRLRRSRGFRGYHSASTSTAYASRAPLPTPMQSSFPAGWLAFAGRVSNSLDHFVGFRSHHDLPPDLRLT
jgi:hypothetical protein